MAWCSGRSQPLCGVVWCRVARRQWPEVAVLSGDCWSLFTAWLVAVLYCGRCH